MKVLRTIGRNAIALIAGVAFCCEPVFALAPAATGGDTETLTRIEMHFFDRSYPQASEDARLSRIEQLVFGQKGSGSDSQRLQRLVKALPTQDIADRTAAPAPGPAKQPPKVAKTAEAPARPLPATDYPSINALEKQVLGATYKGQPVEQRLARLEKREFGAASKEPDLSKRVDRLTSALQEKNGDKTAEAGSIVPFTNNSGWQEDDQQSVPRRTTRGYGSDVGQAFNGNNTARQPSSGFSGSGYSPMASQPPQGYEYANGSPKTENGHPVLRKLGKGMLIAGAVAGIAALGVVSALGSGGVGYGGGMGYGGMGYGGMGYGMPMGMGMGYGMAPMGMGYGMGMRPFGRF